MSSNALELRECVAPEALRDPAGEEAVAYSKQPFSGRADHTVILGPGPHQLEDRGVGIHREAEELPDLVAHVVGGEIDLLRSARPSEVPRGWTDHHPFDIDIRTRTREPVGVASVHGLVDDGRLAQLPRPFVESRGGGCCIARSGQLAWVRRTS